MKHTQGFCGLCGSEGELCDSHLLPASVYKLAREPGAENPNPIIITEGAGIATSKQVSAHFLCPTCEDRFSKGGETYVVGQCARPDGSFELRNVLLATQPYSVHERFSVYDVAPVLGSKTECYVYFASSVFWRASAKAWSFGGPPTKCIVLGESYEEEFRQYLFSTGPFPPKARLFVHVWSDELIHYTSVAPSSNLTGGTRRHKFCIPGILFILFVGGRAVEDHDAFALNGSQGSYLWLCPWENDSLFYGFGQMAARSLASRRRRSG